MSYKSSVATFNALHLGDNLIHLHFLRAMARAYPEIHFTHGAPDQHLAQLAPLCWDLDNLELTSIAHTPQGAINAWRGVEGHWYHHPQKLDFANYHLDWFDVLASRMDGGLESPFTRRTDLIFDYPSLRNKYVEIKQPYEFLVVNSPPKSGQFQGYDHEKFNALVSQLLDYGEVFTTYPTDTSARDATSERLDVTAIGQIAQQCRVIIGTVTGPMWPCLNVWNAETVKLRIHLLDTEVVDHAPNTVHTKSISEVPAILRAHGLF